jgi:RNA polymerase sigma factor (TIGR02999 family)
VVDDSAKRQNGDQYATDELLPAVYDELRKLAKQRLSRELVGNSLQATALVHEAYLRLEKSGRSWRSSAQFFAAAAEAMRRIVVDRARAKKSQKRGGGRGRVQLHDSAMMGTAIVPADEVLLVNDLIDRLAEAHPAEAEIAKLCYFADFNVSEAARALEIPVSTAHKRWNYARAWLRCELEADERQ